MRLNGVRRAPYERGWRVLLLEALIYGYDDEPDPIEFKVDVVQEEE